MRNALQIGAEQGAEDRRRQPGHEDPGARLGLQRHDEVDHFAAAGATGQHV